jgi:Domain of unknown function (DUF4351)
VLDAYGCRELRPALYEAVIELRLRIVVISELPITRETILLRLLGKGRTLARAMADVKPLPEDAWERSIAVPLLVHFRFDVIRAASHPEKDMSAEIEAWFEEYKHQLRSEGHKEGHKEGERQLLLRLLRVRFGDLPAQIVSRVKTADVNHIERWGERILHAQSLDSVFDELS